MRDGRLKYWLGALVWEYRKRTELLSLYLAVIVLILWPFSFWAAACFGVVAVVDCVLRSIAYVAECEMYRRTKWYPVDFRDVRKMATARPSSTDSAPGL